MRAHRKSDEPASTPRAFKFVRRRPDYILRVENRELGVRISATRCLSVREKEFFIRHLVAEGFIPDRYCWFSADCEQLSSAIEWDLEDCSVNSPAEEAGPRRRANGFMLRLLACISITWVIELAIVFLRSR